MAAESDNTQQYTVGNADSDGTSFKLPGDQPGKEPFSLNSNGGQEWVWYVHIDNGFDVNIDVTAEGSHALDEATNNTLDTPVADGSTITVASGEVDFFDGSTGHSFLQLNVAPASDPASGDLVVVIEKRKP